MSVLIVSKSIAMPDRRETIGKAALEGIGHRPEAQIWEIQIREPQNMPNYIVTIHGPSNFKWVRDFFGEEDTPDFIRQEIWKATHPPT